MPWNGYNFEDSILISERIARDDVFTSIHIEEFEVMARDTKLGQEEITRDIPNVGEEALRNLDEAGIVYVGAEVNPGDILVGKVTPKGESPMTPEEKLLRAIFGEKASDVRDTSLRLPPGVSGTIVDVRVFSRRGVDKDERSMAIERAEVERLAKDRDDEKAIQERSFLNRMKEKLLDRKASGGFKGIKAGTVLTEEVLAEHPRGAMRHMGVQDDAVMAEIEQIKREFDASVQRLQQRFENKVDKLQRGDELLPGVMKMVKVFVAVKRKLNVGQILETHLGWACAALGKQVGELVEEYRRTGAAQNELLEKLRDIYGDKVYRDDIAHMSTAQLTELCDNLKKGIPIATPVFDGARMDDIEGMLRKAGLDTSGQVTLTDGRTGEHFERKVTVGYIYMLKLHHLVDDKIHARSIGPYSLVTQQPLGGKAQFGGQRFGEMEVWALEAYGAAYTLQEMLTVKSDDVSGRTKVYEAIVREQDNFEAGIPESFNVLVKELKSLGLNVDLDNQPA
jgi:DNA-directed RNA polymerase subunit beta